MQERVLVIGYRPRIAKRLREHGLSFVIWSDVPVKKKTIPGRLIFRMAHTGQ